ncbi:ROK family protein [Caminibacter sp.]
MLAVDIGGTYLRYKIEGEVKKLKIEEIDLDKFFEEMIKRGVKKIAISFAGQVYNNEILSSPNVKARFDVKKLQKKADVIIENDLNCAVIAESEFFKEKNIAALYSGTGLGSGIIDKKLIRGYRNLAGEIGHIPYKETPFVCGCGKNNCIELFASGKGIKLWSEYFGCESNFKKTCEVVRGNYLRALCVASANIMVLFNPKILVLGGGVIVNNPEIKDYVKENIHKFAPKFSICEIELTRLKNASLKGAEILLRRRDEYTF